MSETDTAMRYLLASSDYL